MLFGDDISPCPASIPSCLAIGPFIHKKGVQACVEDNVFLKSPFIIAFVYAIKIGMYSGGQPAIAPTVATCWAVTFLYDGGISPITEFAEYGVYLKNSLTTS